MDLFDIAVARKLSGGGGGGGDSDFSTAEVTAIMPVPRPVAGFWIVEDELYDSAVFIGTSTHSAILYKGQQVLYFGDDAPSAVSGAAEFVDANVLVKGDCTLTFS